MRTGGFTLAELILGLATTAMVGLSLAGVTAALSDAYDDADTDYSHLQTARAAMARSQSEFRKARLVMGQSEGELLLWSHDDNNNGQINLDEVQLIRWDPREGVIRRHRVVLPSNLSAFMKTLFNLEVSLDVLVRQPALAADAILAHQWQEETVIAEGVTGFEIVPYPAPPETRLVKIQVHTGAGEAAVALRSVIRLRGDCTSWVRFEDGEWDLDRAAAEADGGEVDNGNGNAGGNGNGNGNGGGNGNGNGNGNAGGNGNGNAGGNGNGNGNGGGRFQ